MRSTHTGAEKGKKKRTNIIHNETTEQMYFIFKSIKIMVTLYMYYLFIYLAFISSI